MAAMQRRGAWLAWVALFAVVVVGCLPRPGPSSNPNWFLRIQNDSDTTYYIRIRDYMNMPELHGYDRVALVPGHASGDDLEWWGSSDKPIEVLDATCNPIAVMQAAGTSLSIVQVPGLTAQIEPWKGPVSTDGDIRATMDCGGWMYI